MLHTELHSGPSALDELRVPWQQLVSETTTATPFGTWEWQSTWRAMLGGGRPVVLTVHEGEDLVGLYPLVRSAGPWTTLRPMGIGPSDYLQPLARAGYEVLVAEAIRAAVMEQRVDLLDLQQLREDQALAGELTSLPASRRIEQATCLVLDLPDSYDAYLKSLSQSLRYDMRRLDKLVESGAARIEEHGPQTVNRGLEILFALHGARWRRRGLPGALFGQRAAFHRQWAQAAVQQGWLWLTTLHFDGEPAGALYVMRLGGTAFYYQSGVTIRKGGPSPGTLLLAHAIRRAIDSGVRQLDFLRGDEPYKRRFKPQHELKNMRFLIPGRGMRARAGLGWNTWGAGVEQRIRQRLEGGQAGKPKG